MTEVLLVDPGVDCSCSEVMFPLYCITHNVSIVTSCIILVIMNVEHSINSYKQINKYFNSVMKLTKMMMILRENRIPIEV